MKYKLEIGEEDRQLVVMALAHLAIERPGFDEALSLIAEPIDTGLTLYERFKIFHRARVERGLLTE